MTGSVGDLLQQASRQGKHTTNGGQTTKSERERERERGHRHEQFALFPTLVSQTKQRKQVWMMKSGWRMERRAYDDALPETTLVAVRPSRIARRMREVVQHG